MGDRPLKDVFPGMFRISILKNAMVNLFIELWNDEILGVDSLRRAFRVWEEPELVLLCNCISQTRLMITDRIDKLIWSANPSNLFPVHSLYEGLVPSPGSLIWGNAAPHKVQFLGWLA
ncbi:hypothetical protein CsSME_00050390 [Camellia sinensis var. sinensis]